ncbi:MAG: PQQ-binding-like beta-propeller repeat protein [Verrucomicrobia bacterium]|nr:PQQ-binding-like beta-propeller repeat protein [Verrucomicrobiota bacterium]MCH8512470.1 PQQ-binding-like beta-propeller repeat protein [Kiritimatiellia bacterium]
MKHSKISRLPAFLPILALLLLPVRTHALELADITERDGGDGGLVVLVEPVDTALAQQLAGTDRHLTVLLSADAAKVTQWDEALGVAGAHPNADALHWRTPAVLPFQSNLVNVLVLDRATAARLGEDEVRRVLVPGHGFALIDGHEFRQPRPEGMDVWLGYGRDGSGNRASRDTELQPPNSIQWLMGPRDVRGNDPHMISDRFHIIHHGWYQGEKFGEVFPGGRSDLFVRDAFNGITRWSMPHNGGSDFPWGMMAFSDGRRHYQVKNNHRRTMEIRDLATGEVVQENLRHLKWAEHFGDEENPRSVRMARRPESFSMRVFTDGTRIYHLDGGNIIRAMSLDGQDLLWEHTLPDGEYSDMGAIDGDALAVVVSSTYDYPVASNRNQRDNTNIAKAIMGLDPATGELRWRYDGVEGYPLFYFTVDHGFVVASAHLDSPGSARDNRPHSTRPTLDQVAGNILVSLDAATGREHFKRTDFSDLRNDSLRQNLNVFPDRIVINEERLAYVVDVRTGETLHARIDLGGPRNGWNATTPNWIISNGLFVSHDGSETHDAGVRITWPQYSSFSKPANGMFYVPPGLETIHGSSHVGLMTALVHEDLPSPLADDQRLIVSGQASGSLPATGDWHALRADHQRSGYNPVDGPASLDLAWTAQVDIPSQEGNMAEGRQLNNAIPGALTPAVIDSQRVLVAGVDDHRLICYDLTNGSERWSLRLGGRMVGPPTLAGEVAFVGVNDGTVSAVNLSDGSIIWTFLAAPYERLLSAHHQLESTHPVFPPVLHNGTLYVNAGRHGYADNGIFVWGLNPADGSVRSKTNVKNDHVNDLMQVVGERLRIVNTDLNPETLAASDADRRAAPNVFLQTGGKVGGAGWIRPHIGWRGYQMNSESDSSGGGLVTLMADGFASYTRGRFHEYAFNDLSNSRKEIEVGDISDPQVAGAGRYHYVAGREAGRGAERAIRLAVIDTEAGNVSARFEIPAEAREQVVTDGVSIAHGHVIVTTTAGRVLAFRAP